MDDDFSTALLLVTPPASEPLSLDDAKAFLRIEHTADDAAITRGIVAVRQFAEQYLHCALLPQTWDYTIAHPQACSVNLPFGPAQSIASVTALAADGVTSTTLDSSSYRLSVDGRKVIFHPQPSAMRLTVRYSASLAATPDDLPALIIQGMLHHLAVLMEMRDGIAPLPLASINCYQPYRRIAL